MPSFARSVLLCLTTLTMLAPSATDAGGIPAKTVKNLKAATVYIKVQLRDAIGPLPITGSGFVFQVDGETAYIVTNDHVITPRFGEVREGNPKLVFNSGTAKEKTHEALIVANDPIRDLAVLKVTGVKDLPPAIATDIQSEVAETMTVYSLGFPFGKKLALDKSNHPAINITRGTVTSLRTDSKGEVFLVQIDAEINPGNSGGPIVDDKGNLVGVAVSKVIETRTVGFAIPVKAVSEMMQGRIARLFFDTIQVDKAKAKISVLAGLLNPQGKLSDVAIYYRPLPPGQKSQPDLPKPDKEGKVPLLKDAKEVAIKVDSIKGEGTFYLDRGKSDRQAIVFQASFVNAAGQKIITPASITTIVFPSVIYADKLTRFDPIDKARGQPSKRFTHRMQAGKHYVIEMRGDPKEIDPWLILRDSEGNILAEDDDSGGFPNALIVYSPKKDDDYDISATVFKGDPLGPFSLRIREETGLKLGPKGFTKAGSLRPTDTIDPIMNAPAQTFNFILKKGTPCIVAMNSKDFEPYVRVENMAGINVKYEDLGGEGKSSLTYTPLADGIYRIVATSYDYKTGPFDLKVTEGQPAKQYEVGPQGLKYTSSLSKTDPFDIEFGKPTQFRCQILEVKMKAKQKYQCDLTSNQFDPILRIEDLRGKELAFDKNSGGLRHCRIVFSPAADGIFRVIVSQDSFRLGAFDLSVRPLLPEKGADAWFKQGMAQAKLGKWDQAILDLSKAIELAPNADAAWNERGIAYFRQGKWEKANADFARAADLNPANPIYWSNRGDSFGKLGQHGKAIKDFSRAIDLKPDFTTPWHLRGSARAFLGEWEQAAEDLAKASSFPTATPQACSDLALVRLQLKDSKGYREACARFQDKWTQNRNPQVAVQLAWTAGAVADSGVDFAPVVEALEKNKGKAMMEYAYLRALGAALYRAGKSEEAIKKLQEAANSRKQPTPSVWIFLAMAHHQLGQEDDAQKWLKKAGTWLEEARQKDAEPGAPGPVWWKNLPWTERITLDFTFREAQELLKKPSKSDP